MPLDGRANLLQAKVLNATQSSTRNLPPEILSTIFQHACPTQNLFDRDFYFGMDGGLRELRQHFLLAAVSSTWRQIVETTPQLWRSLVLHYDDFQLLALYIARIGSLPLSLELHTPSSALVKTLSGDQILSRVAPNLGSLILVNPQDDTLDIFSSLELPYLERICVLQQSYRPFWNLNLTGAPVLRHVALRTLPTPHPVDISLEVSWTSITSLHLDWVRTSVCVQTLYQCPNLVDFEVNGLNSDVAGHVYRAPLISPLTLRHLKVFHWVCRFSEPAIHELFRSLRMPVLESLEVICNNETAEPLISLFRNLPQTLQRLRLRRSGVSSEAYSPRLFEHTPSLQELYLGHSSTSFSDDVLAALSLYDTLTGDPIYLPNLRTLTMRNLLTDEDKANAREMVEKRFAGRAELPIFSFPTVLVNKNAPPRTFRFPEVTLVIDDERPKGVTITIIAPFYQIPPSNPFPF